MRRGKIAALSLAALCLALPALAQPRLVQSNPAADATVAAPRIIRLTFSDIIAPTSDLTLSMADGMSIAAAISVSADGKTLIAHPTSPFMSGKWILTWHAVAQDGQQSQGAYSFTIK